MDAAVSDVVGSILLVGMTVGMTVVLALLLMTFDGPEPTPHTRLAVSVSPGAGGWGTGDEEVRVRHIGGDALGDETRVLLRIGTSTADLEGAALGGAFSDGELAIGETWTRTSTIRATDLVGVDVVAGAGLSRLVSSVALVPGGVAP